MTKGRLLSKVIILSRKLNQISEGSENLYYRLLATCDDFGRFHADPIIIKGQLYTLKKITPAIIEKRLSELVKIGLIKLYEDNGEKYLEITKFDNHQIFRSDYNRKSDYPVPAKYIRGDVTKSNEAERSQTRSPSNSNSTVQYINSNSNADSQNEIQKHFDAFYEAYPRKIAKDDAFIAFKALIKTIPVETIASAVNGYNNFLKTKMQNENKEFKEIIDYVLYPASFLRKNKWKDYIDFKYEPRL